MANKLTRVSFLINMSTLVALCLALAVAKAEADETDGSANPTGVAQGQETVSFADQVALLIAANPDGGIDLELALNALVAAQPDGAAAVAALMVALGSSPMPGVVTAVTKAIEKAAPYTPEALQEAVAMAVVAAKDPATAVRSVINASASLPLTTQAAAGRGMAAASAQLAAAGNTTAVATIAIEIAKAPIGISVAFDTAQSAQQTAGTNTKNNPAGKKDENPDTTPETSASPN